jgi:hypothetical protein
VAFIKGMKTKNSGIGRKNGVHKEDENQQQRDRQEKWGS